MFSMTSIFKLCSGWQAYILVFRLTWSGRAVQLLALDIRTADYSKNTFCLSTWHTEKTFGSLCSRFSLLGLVPSGSFCLRSISVRGIYARSPVVLKNDRPTVPWMEGYLYSYTPCVALVHRCSDAPPRRRERYGTSTCGLLMKLGFVVFLSNQLSTHWRCDRARDRCFNPACVQSTGNQRAAVCRWRNIKAPDFNCGRKERRYRAILQQHFKSSAA